MMKDDKNVLKLFVTLLVTTAGLLGSIVSSWVALSSQVIELRSEVRYLSSQMVGIKAAFETHAQLASHPVTDERLKQLSSKIDECSKRLATIEFRP